MLAFLKSLPFVGIALLMAYGAHSFIVGNLNDSIDKLQMQVEQYVAQNVALQTAADLNENTIRSLEEGAKKQREQITNLTDNLNVAVEQKNEALRIFNDHDITKLAKNKPGLMEPRANKATKLEFDGIEELSKDNEQKD
jgi:LPS O-antigen subunit length determinant protein (WzzB/FepE family)